jgi:uncharacterized phiE125 gp8 family phage protein
MTELTTLDAVKAYMGVTSTADDALLGSLITAVSQYVRTYTNRDFTVTDYTQLFDGQNNTRQMLPQYPVQSVASVQIGTQAVAASPGLGQSGFRFDTNSIVLAGYRFCHGEANVQITWTAGYPVIPADLAQAVNELVGLRYKLRGDNMGWVSKTLAGEVVTLVQKDMPDSVRTILNNYRAVVPL